MKKWLPWLIALVIGILVGALGNTDKGDLIAYMSGKTVVYRLLPSGVAICPQFTGTSYVNAPKFSFTATVDTTTTKPDAGGVFAKTANFDIYIGTCTNVPGCWVKVGGP